MTTHVPVLTVDGLVARIVLPLVAGHRTDFLEDTVGGLSRFHVQHLALAHYFQYGLKTVGKGLLGAEVVLKQFATLGF